MFDDNINNLIDVVLNRFDAFERSTFVMLPGIGGDISVYRGVYIDFGIINNDTVNTTRQSLVINCYSIGRDSEYYRSCMKIPITCNESINDEIYRSVCRLLIRRIRQLLSNLMFKRVMLFPNPNSTRQNNSYITHNNSLTATDDNGSTFRHVECYLIPCIVFMLNNDNYLKDLAKISLNASCVGDGGVINSVDIEINNVRTHRLNIEDMVNSYNVDIFEQ